MSAIQVENLGKRYIIGHQNRNDTLRDALTHGLKGVWLQLRNRRIEKEDFWALRNVTFKIEPGEVTGIIGRNGAGKSTLLKLLSRITEPSQGRITIQGRIASLLEVGTGFHPELSGRENIFLNGAILGMSRVEIEKKFDEIVAFAEVERFLDTPVKRYSSGMYVRLAFAIAAHLEPEILIVDEVLAVGDAQFQQKCIQRMKSITRESGRTILFVSHQLKTIEQLCPRSMLLDSGRLVQFGPTSETMSDYMRRNAPKIKDEVMFEFNEELRVTQLRMPATALTAGTGSGDFSLTINCLRDCRIFDLHFYINDTFGERQAIIDLRDPESEGGVRSLSANANIEYRGKIQRMALVEGDYRVGLCIRTARCFKAIDDLIEVQVKPPQTSPHLNRYASEYLGNAHLDYEFKIINS